MNSLRKRNGWTGMDNSIRVNSRCQIFELSAITKPLSFFRYVLQRVKKVRHAIIRRCYFSMAIVRRIFFKKSRSLSNVQSLIVFHIGEVVKVRSKEDVMATLDNWKKLKGCGFMTEMEQYCGTIQRVKKQVRNFMDERDYLVKKCKNMYILDGLMCEGVKDFGPCDRSCYFFWRAEWLEKVDFPSTNSKNS